MSMFCISKKEPKKNKKIAMLVLLKNYFIFFFRFHTGFDLYQDHYLPLKQLLVCYAKQNFNILCEEKRRKKKRKFKLLLNELEFHRGMELSK